MDKQDIEKSVERRLMISETRQLWRQTGESLADKFEQADDVMEKERLAESVNEYFALGEKLTTLFERAKNQAEKAYNKYGAKHFLGGVTPEKLSEQDHRPHLNELNEIHESVQDVRSRLKDMRNDLNL